VDGKAMWMGKKKFYLYDGFVREIPCEVGDYVFTRVNQAQASKVAVDVRADFSEITWYYPTSSECDSSVTYNWALNHWTLGGGTIARTDGIDAGSLLQYPLASGTGGAIYEHENGSTYQDEGGTTFTPYIESGPVEIGNGDHVQMIRSFIPDEVTLGSVNLTLYGRFYPSTPDTTFGPYTLANPTDIRATARSFRMKLTQVGTGWRFGTGRWDVVQGGLR
jgi:hypothetical protein